MATERADLVRRIGEKLRGISANDLQVLAEHLAMILKPERFGRADLVVHGRNLENQTRSGWPDAYVEAAGGRVHAIEATRQADWVQHVRDDARKAVDGKNRPLASYFFVGGHPRRPPTARDRRAARDALLPLRLKQEDITLLVGQDLIEALSAPECARVRQLLLGIEPTPRLFRALRPGVTSRRATDPTQPTDADFQEGRVFKPALLTQVVDGLADGGRVLVRGQGASGKTTLAHLVAAHPQVAPKPVYYLDIGERTDPLPTLLSDLAADVVAFGASGVTFVIDNIHVDEAFALEALKEFDAAAPPGSALLLLGRERVSIAGTPVGDVRPLMLRARSPELLGVVQRLLAKRGLQAPPITDADLNRWVATFGGPPQWPHTGVDLIAFAAAAERRLEAIASGNFVLRNADAVDGVRARYIAPLRNPAERENLLRLAALEALDVAAREEELPHPALGFPWAFSEGLVLRDIPALEGRPRYRLTHPVLGPLILEAADILILPRFGGHPC